MHTKELKLPLQKRLKQKAKEKGFDRVHEVSNYKQVVHVLKEDDDWSITPIIAKIKKLTSLFSFADFSFFL